MMDVPAAIISLYQASSSNFAFTYQSRIMILRHLSPRTCWHALAATETLLNRQKPIVLLLSAWWPGGRITAIAFLTRSSATALHVSIAPPHESSADVNVNELK